MVYTVVYNIWKEVMVMREKIMRFMQGRYGVDQLSNFLIVCALVIMFVEMIIGNPKARVAGNTISMLLILAAYMRILSRNHYKRYEENQRYMKYHNKVKFFVQKQINLLKQRKTHHIYKCPQCRQSIRVPRGKGRIAITCPKCRTEFIKKS